MRLSTRTPLAALALVVVGLLVGAPALANPVAPRNCGMSTIDGHRYQIKADQIRCSTAKRWSRTYLTTDRRPRGYSCRDYDSGTRLKFRCWRREKVFFAINR
jgi:hypothetical protein